MKESIKGTDKRLVFRETFCSEACVRANGGTPTGVTYSNGIGTFDGGATTKITYPVIPSGTYSVRIRLNNTTLATKYLFDARFSGTGTGMYIHITVTSGLLQFGTGGTAYVNGAASTTVTTGSCEVVIAGISHVQNTSGTVMTVGNRSDNNYGIASSFELFEIYQGTLSANEVKNLYENKQNRELQNAKTQTATTELIVNANDRTFESGTTGNWIGTFKATSFAASTEQAHAGTYSAKFVSDGTGSGEIRLSNTSNNYIAANSEGGYVTAWVYSSHAGVTLSGRGLGNTAYASSASTTINGWQQLTVFVPDGVYATTSYGVWFTIPSGATVYIDDVSWVKLTNNTYNEILRVDARNGVINNKYTGSVASLTDLNSGYDFTSGWTTVSTTVNSATSFTTTGAGGIYKGILTAGKYYRVRIAGTITGGGTLTLPNTGGGSFTGTFDTVHYGTQTTNSNLYLSIAAGNTVNITTLTVQEAIPVITNTATTVTRSDGIWTMDFNNSTSKVDCGSYNTLIGDKTLIVWARPRSSGEALYGRLIDSGKFSSNISLNQVLFSRDSATIVFSAANAVKYYTWNLVVVTSTSTGISNVYVNGVASGTANQSGGTPSAATTSIIIGNDSAQTRTFDGQLSNVRIIDGILNSQEIAQIYQSEKSQYGL